MHPVNLTEEPADERESTQCWLPKHRLIANRVLLVAGPSLRNPNASHRLELMRLGARSAGESLSVSNKP